MKAKMALLILLLFVSGCYSWSPDWVFYKVYEGEERSLDEVAVVFVEPGWATEGVDVWEIDGQHIDCYIYGFWLFLTSKSNCHELHLLPGDHTIVTHYRTGLCVYCYSSLLRLPVHFRKGQVYEIEGERHWHDDFSNMRERITLPIHFRKGQVYKTEGPFSTPAPRWPHEVRRAGTWTVSIKHVGSVREVAYKRIKPKIQRGSLLYGFPWRPPDHWERFLENMQNKQQ